MTAHFHLFPAAASTFAGQVDALTLCLLAISGFIVALVAGLILTFGILYRKNSPSSREISERGQSLLEWGWTGVTFLLFLGLFAWGAELYLHMHEAPADSSEIMVVAKQWMWKFQHPDGRRELNELHIPVGRPILLTMTSQDVIHSLFVPAFRIKQDVLPGRYVHTWFEASKAGEYHLFCTQYCGTMHAGMQGKVVAMSPTDYQAWLQAGVDQTVGTLHGQSMGSRGRGLFTRLGCISCHGANPGVKAPTLAGIYGRRASLSDGTSVQVDEEYIRESILNPNAKIVEGYQPLMPSFKGVVNEEDLFDLVAYIKSLETTPTGEAP